VKERKRKRGKKIPQRGDETPPAIRAPKKGKKKKVRLREENQRKKERVRNGALYPAGQLIGPSKRRKRGGFLISAVPLSSEQGGVQKKKGTKKQ